MGARHFITLIVVESVHVGDAYFDSASGEKFRWAYDRHCIVFANRTTMYACYRQFPSALYSHCGTLTKGDSVNTFYRKF